MKAREWIRILAEQKLAHDKALFTVTELAHLGQVGRNVLNVELSRLRRQGLVVRYAQGLYGLPGAVSAEELLPAIDSHAYLTGLYALHRHGLVTQIPRTITCFTDRRSPRARVRSTPVGRFELVCVRSEVHAPPTKGILASPEQALCDFVYLCRRGGVEAAAQITLRNVHLLRAGKLESVARRYPTTVGLEVARLLNFFQGGPPHLINDN